MNGPAPEIPYAQRADPEYTTAGMHPLLARQPRYCLMCGEALKLPDSLGVQARCGKCERPFDPKDPATFLPVPPATPLKWWQSDAVPGAAWLALYALGSAAMGGLIPHWADWIGGGAGAGQPDPRAGQAAGMLIAVMMVVFLFVPWLFACVYLLLVAVERHLKDQVMWYLTAGGLGGAVFVIGYHPALVLVGLFLGLLAGLVRQWRMSVD